MKFSNSQEVMLVRIVVIQAQLGRKLTLEEKLFVFKQRPDFVCLPEYYALDESVSDFHRAALHSSEYREYLRRLSDELSICLIGGSVVEGTTNGLYNTSYVYDRGNEIGHYRKISPVPSEQDRGICEGSEYLILEREGVRFSVLLCGDVFFPAHYEAMAKREIDIVFIPTTSPFRPADSLTRKRKRDRKYYQEGAMVSGAYVAKVCGVGSLFGKELQGRSLITAPWEMLARVETVNESSPRILSVVLDIDELRDFRRRFNRSHMDPSLAGNFG